VRIGEHVMDSAERESDEMKALIEEYSTFDAVFYGRSPPRQLYDESVIVSS